MNNIIETILTSVLGVLMLSFFAWLLRRLFKEGNRGTGLFHVTSVMELDTTLETFGQFCYYLSSLISVKQANVTYRVVTNSSNLSTELIVESTSKNMKNLFSTSEKQLTKMGWKLTTNELSACFKSEKLPSAWSATSLETDIIKVFTKGCPIASVTLKHRSKEMKPTVTVEFRC